jgi:hypothetical protein
MSTIVVNKHELFDKNQNQIPTLNGPLDLRLVTY